MIADDNKDFYFEIYLNLKPNILLLDFDLPIINGIEIINKLTSISKKIMQYNCYYWFRRI